MSAFAGHYLVFKAIHVIFMVTWFAGLFYLPRLFIYHAGAGDTASRERFTTMERRLFGIMTIGAVLTMLFGFLLIGINHALLEARWFLIKLALVGGLIVYHVRCYQWMKRLRDLPPTDDTRWLRWFNEIPTLFLFAVVLLAIMKPF